MPDIVYPYKKFRYTVECKGLDVAGFSEISAPDATIEQIKYREGNYATTESIKLPGRIEYTNITLKKGLTDSMAFFNWVSQIAAGTIERQSMTIKLLGDKGDEVAVWELTNAWPCKYKGTEFNATASTDVAIEEIELAFESMKRSK